MYAVFSIHYTDYAYSILSVSTSPVYLTRNGGLSYDIGHVRCPLCGQKRLPLGSCPSTLNTRVQASVRLGQIIYAGLHGTI